MGDDGDTGDLRDVRLHARQPFHLRLDVAFGLVHAVTCGIAFGPLGAMDGEGAFERVFVVGLGAIAHALVALSTHWSVRHPYRIPRDPHSSYAVVSIDPSVPTFDDRRTFSTTRLTSFAPIRPPRTGRRRGCAHVPEDHAEGGKARGRDI